MKSQLHPFDEDEVLGLLLLMDAVGDGGVGGDGDGEGLGQEGLQVDTHHPAGEDGATCKEGGYRGRCLSMFIAGTKRITYDFMDQLQLLQLSCPKTSNSQFPEFVFIPAQILTVTLLM